jgi:predicted alpha/beta superfamily hydrolase
MGPGLASAAELETNRAVLHSEILNEDRAINVVLPPTIAPNARFPVVVVLDGEPPFFPTAVERMRRVRSDLIFVGVENTDRTRDMFPKPVPDKRNRGGGADRFLEFLVVELLPYLEEQVPGDGRYILSGQSNSGFFALYALCGSPGAFEAIIAASPMIGWDWETLSTCTEDLFTSKAALPMSIFLNHGESDSTRTTEYLPQYVSLIERLAPTDFRWTFKIAAGESHVPDSSHAEGIAFVFRTSTD